MTRGGAVLELAVGALRRLPDRGIGWTCRSSHGRQRTKSVSWWSLCIQLPAFLGFRVPSRMSWRRWPASLETCSWSFGLPPTRPSLAFSYPWERGLDEALGISLLHLVHLRHRWFRNRPPFWGTWWWLLGARSCLLRPIFEAFPWVISYSMWNLLWIFKHVWYVMSNIVIPSQKRLDNLSALCYK